MSQGFLCFGGCIVWLLGGLPCLSIWWLPLNTVEARKLKHDCPPTPKPGEEGKPAYIVLGPQSHFLGVYCSPGPQRRGLGPRDPNGPILFIHFRPQCWHYLHTWMPRRGSIRPVRCQRAQYSRDPLLRFGNAVPTKFLHSSLLRSPHPSVALLAVQLPSIPLCGTLGMARYFSALPATAHSFRICRLWSMFKLVRRMLGPWTLK